MTREIGHAIALHRAGRVEDAADMCRGIIGDQPEDALHLLGMIAHQTGNAEAALSLVQRAIDHKPAAAHHHYARGAILQQQRRLEDALAAYDHALRIKPDLAQAHLNRGVILEQRARLREALEAFDQALRIEPDYARAHFNRGVVLERQGQWEPAVAAYDQALRIRPDHVEAHVNRGVALEALGRSEQALEAFDQALRIKPEIAEGHFNRGNALRRLGRLGEALAAYAQALRIKPDYARAYFNLGDVLERQGRLAPAITAYDQALRIEPDWAAVHVNRGNALRELGRTTEALAAYDRALRLQPDLAMAHGNRGNALSDQGRFKEAAAAYEHALRLKPDYAESHSNHLFCLNYDPSQDDAALLAAHLDWARRHGRPARVYTNHSSPRDPERTLRVGLVSADFGRHPVGFFLAPLLAAGDPARVQFVGYSGRSRDDALTERLREGTCGWRSTLELSDEQLADVIRADRIDILIDLSGHTGGNRLGCIARRPAPIQVHWAGYCHSVPVVDYSLWDAIQVPKGDERWFVEEVLRLPDTRWCYAPPDYAPEVSDPPVLERGYITFGSFNNLTKVNSEVLDLWTAVLEAVPRSRLLLNWRTLSDSDECERYRAEVAARGIELDRLELRRGKPTHAAVLGEYADVDIALDPFPFSGCLTTCEALWIGLPLVTLPRSRPVSRQSQAFLTALGRTEWVARTADDYVRIAADLASDWDRLAALRAAQRACMAASPVCDGPGFARHFEAALRGIWHSWCASEVKRNRSVRGPGRDSCRRMDHRRSD